MPKLKQYVGLEVSLEETSIAVIDEPDNLVWRGSGDWLPDRLRSRFVQREAHASSKPRRWLQASTPRIVVGVRSLRLISDGNARSTLGRHSEPLHPLPREAIFLAAPPYHVAAESADILGTSVVTAARSGSRCPKTLVALCRNEMLRVPILYEIFGAHL